MHRRHLEHGGYGGGVRPTSPCRPRLHSRGKVRSLQYQHTLVYMHEHGTAGLCARACGLNNCLCAYTPAMHQLVAEACMLVAKSIVSTRRVAIATTMHRFFDKQEELLQRMNPASMRMEIDKVRYDPCITALLRSHSLMCSVLEMKCVRNVHRSSPGGICTLALCSKLCGTSGCLPSCWDVVRRRRVVMTSIWRTIACAWWLSARSCSSR